MCTDKEQVWVFGGWGMGYRRGIERKSEGSVGRGIDGMEVDGRMIQGGMHVLGVLVPLPGVDVGDGPWVVSTRQWGMTSRGWTDGYTGR